MTMANFVIVNLIHFFIARFDTVWRTIIVRHYCEYRFWRAIEAREAFYSRPCLQKLFHKYSQRKELLP